MKKVLRLFTIFSVIAMLFTACKKEETPISLQSSMSAKIDGVNWSATSAGITAQKVGDVFNIIGTSSTLKAINLTINGTEEKEYVLSVLPVNLGFGAIYIENPINSEGYVAVTGSVSITKVDAANKRVSGTFSFKAKKQDIITEVEVAEGVFNNVKYIEQEIQ